MKRVEVKAVADATVRETWEVEVPEALLLTSPENVRAYVQEKFDNGDVEFLYDESIDERDRTFTSVGNVELGDTPAR